MEGIAGGSSVRWIVYEAWRGLILHEVRGVWVVQELGSIFFWERVGLGLWFD